MTINATTPRPIPIPARSLDSEDFDARRLARLLKISEDRAHSIALSLIQMFHGRDVRSLSRAEWHHLFTTREAQRETCKQLVDLYGIDEDAYLAQHPDGLDLTNV